MLFLYLALMCFVCTASGKKKAPKKLFTEYPESILGKHEIKNATKTTGGVDIVMTSKEVTLFERYLANATNYFEFGCGGSTVLACKTGQTNLSVTSIDSSREWIDKIKRNPHVADRAARKLLQMNIVDIGPVKKWGFPNQTAEASHGAWYLYSQSISLTDKKYDLVLVDGRFRVACVLNTYISNPHAPVLIHDFFGQSFHHNAYKVLLNVSNVVDRAESLAVLRVKTNIKKEELVKLYGAFINVPERR